MLQRSQNTASQRTPNAVTPPTPSQRAPTSALLTIPRIIISTAVMSQRTQGALTQDNRNVPDKVVLYQLDGECSIESPFNIEHLPEISQRSAVIMAAHLLYQHSFTWGEMLSFLGSSMFRQLLSNNPPAKRFFDNGLKKKILEFSYINYGEMNKREPKPSENLDHTVEGGVELLISSNDSSHEFIIVVKYKLHLNIWPNRPKPTLGSNVNMAVEPHSSWNTLFDQFRIFRLQQTLQQQDSFSAARVDDSMLSEIKKQKPLCFSYRENSSSS